MDGYIPSGEQGISHNSDMPSPRGRMHQLCAFCRVLSEQELRPYNPATIDELGKVEFNGSSRTKSQLEQANSMGCSRCQLILAGLKIYEKLLGTEQNSFVVYDHVRLVENGNAMGVQIVPFSTTDGSKILNLVFHVTSSRQIAPQAHHSDLLPFHKSWLTTQHWQPVTMAWFLALNLPLPIRSPDYLKPSMEEGDFGRPAFECSDSPAVFECIQAWIQRCNSEHESCRLRDTSDVPLPTRLLDVQSEDICLVETAKNHQGRYVCLSHCWGGYQPIRTLQGNLERHKTGIPWNILPKTFQDAVTIVRRTGHRYLWIDSLCIIQDSTSDWEAEAAQMADIYSRAHFTIAALSAKNSKGGCFPAYNPEYRAHPVSTVNFEGKSSSVFVRQDYGHPAGQFMSQNTVLGRGPAYPLLDRAWVFQERNLSPRVIYFGKTEIFWECNTAGYCGCRPGIKRDPDRPACLQTEPWRKWQLIVDRYRSLSLTMAKDTFPALSGLAIDFNRENKGLGRYLAGHWEAHLPRCLAWTTRESRSAGTHWRAPSWSWASVPCATYSLRELEPACSVIAVECKQAGVNPYGELAADGSGCWIELSGRLFPGTLRYEIARQTLEIDMKTTYGHGYFTGDLEFGMVGSPDAIPAEGTIELRCLHLGISKDHEKGNADIFLALRKFQHNGEYERVGLVSFNQRHGTIFPDGQLYSQNEATVRIR